MHHQLLRDLHVNEMGIKEVLLNTSVVQNNLKKTNGILLQLFLMSNVSTNDFHKVTHIQKQNKQVNDDLLFSTLH